MTEEQLKRAQAVIDGTAPAEREIDKCERHARRATLAAIMGREGLDKKQIFQKLSDLGEEEHMFWLAPGMQFALGQGVEFARINGSWRPQSEIPLAKAGYYMDERLTMLWKLVNVSRKDPRAPKSTAITDGLSRLTDHDLQTLFLNALEHNDFEIKTCRALLDIDPQRYARWKKEPLFNTALKEMDESKKDLAEEKMWGLVKDSVPAAVIHVNKSLNSDRGFGEKFEMNHSGSVDINLTRINELNLPLEILLAIEAAVTPKPVSDLCSQPLASNLLTVEAVVIDEKEPEEVGAPSSQ